MPLPTLLQKGFLKTQKWMNKTEQNKVENSIPIEYIINFLSDRIPQSKNGKPKITPKKIGDKILVLKSSTGSGKSTVFPSYLYKHFIERVNKNIAVTQPRILTCIDIPTTMVQYSKELEMDKNIGYRTSKFSRLPKEKGIIYCTTETLTQQYLTSEEPEDFMKKYSFICIDEVHTRDLGIDRLLYLMKQLLTDNYDNPECPFIIIMSATFDEKLFMDYFDVSKEHYIMVDGFTYPITPSFPKYDIIDFQQYAYKKALQLHIDNIADIYGKETSIYRDIIIFVPTSSIGEKLVLKLLEYNYTIFDKDWNYILNWKKENLDVELDKLLLKNDNPNLIEGGDESMKHNKFYILPILLTKNTFEAGGLEYQNLFSSLETVSLPLWKVSEKHPLDIKSKPFKFVKPSRRIIVCTNIAETGITIDTLKYCIDTGYEFNIKFLPDFGSNMIVMKECTQGMVTQRKGRVGRKSPGFWFPCFTEKTFNALLKDQFAEIIIAEPLDNILNILIIETETKIKEEVSLTFIKNEEKRKELNLFQRNFITDKIWWKLTKEKKLNLGIMDFLEMPSGSSLQYSLEKLHCLGMIDDEYNVTLYGYLSNLIRFIPIETKRMILGGFHTGAFIMDLITITSFIYTGKLSLFSKTFKMPNILDKPNFEFIYKILIGDELIGCILLWNDFNEWITNKINKTFKNISKNRDYITTSAIKKWCEERNILYNGWIQMISNRDVLIESLTDIGINIYYNSLGLPVSEYNLKNILLENLDEGLEEIRKIKEAIYSGFHMNVCIWNNSLKQFVINKRNIPVSITSEILSYITNKPNHIIITNYLFTQGSTSLTFEFSSTGFISVLDNYINVDNKLNIAY
jgi:HrpA-like RNA helicase